MSKQRIGMIDNQNRWVLTMLFMTMMTTSKDLMIQGLHTISDM